MATEKSSMADTLPTSQLDWESLQLKRKAQRKRYIIKVICGILLCGLLAFSNYQITYTSLTKSLSAKITQECGATFEHLAQHEPPTEQPITDLGHVEVDTVYNFTVYENFGCKGKSMTITGSHSTFFCHTFDMKYDATIVDELDDDYKICLYQHAGCKGIVAEVTGIEPCKNRYLGKASYKVLKEPAPC